MSQPYDTSDFRSLFSRIEDDRLDRQSAEGLTENPELIENLDHRRLKDLAILLLDPRPGMRILEIGIGAGANAVPIGLQGASLAGVDLNKSSVARARQHFQHFAIADPNAVRVGDATKLEFADNEFDAAFSSDFHEHLTEDQQLDANKEVLRVLRPGGRLIIKTPNLRYLNLSLNYKRLRALAKGKDPRGFVIPATPHTPHVGLTTRKRLTANLIEAGFGNYEWRWAPLRRFGYREMIEVFSTEVPIIRDWLCEDLICVAWKPINSSHFPPV